MCYSREMTQNKRCSIEGCQRTDIEARGWCLLHYSRWRYNGDPNYQRPGEEERFWAKVNKAGSCWTWTASTSTSGYGHFRYKGKVREAHLVSYMMCIGSIPEGKQLDHTCHTRDTECVGGVECPHRRCVNPAHLEPVTSLENSKRGKAGEHLRSRTHCPQGHEYTEANTYYAKRGNGYNRMCRECGRLRRRERYRRLGV